MRFKNENYGPNIFNAVIGVSKVLGGQRLTNGEAAAMDLALSDDKIVNELASVLDEVKNQQT